MLKTTLITAAITATLITTAPIAAATHEGDSHAPVSTWSPPTWGTYPVESTYPKDPTWSPPTWGTHPHPPTWPGTTNNPCCSR